MNFSKRERWTRNRYRAYCYKVQGQPIRPDACSPIRPDAFLSIRPNTRLPLRPHTPNLIASITALGPHPQNLGQKLCPNVREVIRIRGKITPFMPIRPSLLNLSGSMTAYKTSQSKNRRKRANVAYKATYKSDWP